MSDNAPVMSIGMHAAVTVLGLAFLFITSLIGYEIVAVGITWKLVTGGALTLSIAIDLFAGAFRGRLPISALIWFAPFHPGTHD